MTEHEINVRNALLLALAAEDPNGIVGVLERSKDPDYVRTVNALAMAASPGMTPEAAAERLIASARMPRVAIQIAADPLETAGKTVALYDLYSLEFCTLRKSDVRPGTVDSLHKDAATILELFPEDPVIAPLAREWERLDVDHAVEIWLMPDRSSSRFTGPAYRNASDLIVV